MTYRVPKLAFAFAAACAVAIWAAATPVRATAETPPPPPPPAEADDDSSLRSTAPAADDDSADARDEPALFDEIVVTANLGLTERSDVGSAITVLERDDIERHRWPTVADALRTVPGLEIARSGGPGQLTSLFVRGGSSSQTLVLLDGLRLNSATTGAVDLADLTTDDVERIEILRGPQSTLYGSEAAAGVVSILTSSGGGSGSRGRDPGTRVSLLAEVGEDDHARVRAGVASHGSQIDGGLSASWLDIDGVSAADARRGNAETDGHQNLTLAGRVGVGLGDSDDGRLDLSLRRVAGDVEVDGFSFFAGPVDDLDAANERDALYAGLRASLPLGRRWSQTARLGWADDELTGRDPGNPFGDFTIDSRRLEAESRADVALGARHLASVGASFERREGGSVGSFDEEVEIVAFYAQDRWTPRDRVSVTVGARHDDHEQFGDETTWRLAAALGVGAQGRIHASWGTGFKAPTFNDLYFPGFSNPDLRAETTRAWDLGVEQLLADGRLRLDLTVFDLEADDLIAFDFLTFLPQNIAEASSRGVEASAAWRGTRTDLRGSYTWNETEDGATGEPLARRPEHRAVVDVGRRLGAGVRVAASAWASRDRIDSDGTELEDLERLDLTVQWSAADAAGSLQGLELEPYLRVLNVFDDVASEVGGFGSRGRTALVGLSARWGG